MTKQSKKTPKPNPKLKTFFGLSMHKPPRVKIGLVYQKRIAIRSRLTMFIHYQNLMTALAVMALCFTWYGLKPANPANNTPKTSHDAQTLDQFINETITNASKLALPDVPKIANCHTHPCVALTFDDGPDTA